MTTVPRGHYAQKQLHSSCAVIRWSHRARFRMAARLAGAHPNGKLLDYGCGDGTFIGLVAGRFAACVGADVAPDQLTDCRNRFAAIPNVKFCLVDDLLGPEHTQAYAIVTCMEALEHCLDAVIDKVLLDLDRLCARDGTIIISVPVETGAVFPVKYLVRKIAGWQGLAHYDQYESYSTGDALRMLFATAHTTLIRPVYGGRGTAYHSHYGFNWRRLRDRVARAFRIERTIFSPVRVLGGWMNSQVWLVCRPVPTQAPTSQTNWRHSGHA